MNRLVEKRQEMEAKQKKLADVFVEMGSDLDLERIKSLSGTAAEKAALIKRMNDELADIGKEVESLVAVEEAAKASKALQDRIVSPATTVTQPAAQPAQEKSLGDLFVESRSYKAFREQQVLNVPSTLDIPMKTAMTTAAGWAPESTRIGRVAEYATRPIQVLDLVPYGQTGQAAVVYMEETTFTDAAAEATESSGAFGEAALALTERSVTVQNIAVWLPVTMQQLEDVEQVRSYINNRLSFMVRRRLDYQILNGDGIAPNLAGILENASIQSFALAGDRFDAIYDAIKRVRVTGRANPNVVVIHPNDWQQIRLMRDDNGLYILGNPGAPGPDRIWGLPVVEADAEPEGTPLVGDFAGQCSVFEKRGVQIDITDSHDTYFIYGKYAVRATLRVAFVAFRPAAFCKVTGF